MTAGSVLFAGVGGLVSQDNANFFFDNTNNRLGLGNAAPTVTLDVTGAVKISSTLAVTGDTTLLGNLTVDDVGTFFVDSTQNFVGIGTLAPTLPGGSSGLQILADGSLAEFLFTAYRTASPRALIKMQGSRGTLAAPTALVSGSEITRIDGEGYTASAFERATEISFQMGTGTVGSGSAPGRIVFSTSPDATTSTTEKFRIDSTNVVFNENSLDHDFRIESDTNTSCFFLDGGNSFIGINNATPSAALDVTGAVEISTTLTVTGDVIVDTSAFVVDTSNNRVGIGIAAPANAVDIVASSTETSGVKVLRSMTDISATKYGVFSIPTNTITANNSNKLIAFRGDCGIDQNGFNGTNTFSVVTFDGVTRVIGATGTVTGAATLYTNVAVTNGGTLTNAYGIFVTSNTSTASTLTNNYGLFMQTQTAGSTNWAIYSEGGQSAHTGNLRIGSTTAPTVALDVTGAVTISGNVTVDTDVFFVDTTNNRVGFGTATPTITTGADGFQIMADNNNIAEMRLTAYRTSGPRPLLKGQASLGTLASPTAFSVAGTSCFRIDGEYNTGSQFNRACEIEFYSGTGTIGDNTSSPGRIIFSTTPDGTIATTEKLRIGPSEIVVNENSLDHDFRIESDANANCFFLDAGNSRIGIMNAAPTVVLDVTGQALITQNTATAAQAPLNLIQDSTTGTIECLTLQQDDVSEGCINFVASARGAITLPVTSAESVRVELNGVIYRLALFTDA